jgi:hypothetical protein
MTLRALVFYIIPAVLIMYGVGLLILTKVQKRYLRRSGPDRHVGVKGPAE